MENPIKMDDLGGKTPIFGNTHSLPTPSILGFPGPPASQRLKDEIWQNDPNIQLKRGCLSTTKHTTRYLLKHVLVLLVVVVVVVVAADK